MNFTEVQIACFAIGAMLALWMKWADYAAKILDRQFRKFESPPNHAIIAFISGAIFLVGVAVGVFSSYRISDGSNSAMWSFAAGFALAHLARRFYDARRV